MVCVPCYEATTGVNSETDFEWLSQLRMYLEEEEAGNPETLTVMERMMNAEIEYGYEYLGNSSRLVGINKARLPCHSPHE